MVHYCGPKSGINLKKAQNLSLILFFIQAAIYQLKWASISHDQAFDIKRWGQRPIKHFTHGSTQVFGYKDIGPRYYPITHWIISTYQNSHFTFDSRTSQQFKGSFSDVILWQSSKWGSLPTSYRRPGLGSYIFNVISHLSPVITCVKKFGSCFSRGTIHFMGRKKRGIQKGKMNS